LIEGATPALASAVGQLAASTGMTQGTLLQRLRYDHSVGWGVKKLRQVLAALAAFLEPQRHKSQVAKVLELLAQARTSTGKHKPVLAVGRDGVTLGIRIGKGNVYEVATTATLSVIDRSGKRLGTVYLAYTPEQDQLRMSRELTRLLKDVLLIWTGSVPALCYISDAGQSESGYYQRELARLEHPRTGQRLKWTRIVDFYHASQRVWTLADCLFGADRPGKSWARKIVDFYHASQRVRTGQRLKWIGLLEMLTWLKAGGVRRVLHSAAAHRSRLGLSGKKLEELQKAYRYLRKRMKYMKYHEYRRLGMPLGSGVTEAACKTIYTQRLKLSGMRWSKAGAQVILDLRVLLLSAVWDRAFLQAISTRKVAKLSPQEAARCQMIENAV
jgi:hypothetical protein